MACVRSNWREDAIEVKGPGEGRGPVEWDLHFSMRFPIRFWVRLSVQLSANRDSWYCGLFLA
jgi:hypothetical protein